MKKFQYNSPVVISFFLISFAALVLGWLSNNWTTASLFSVYRSSFRDPCTYIRLISHVLGHADLEHFFGNMLMFLVIGPPLEERYGSRVLLTGILLTALISGLLQTVLFPIHPFYQGRCSQLNAYYRRNMRYDLRLPDQ